MAEFMNDTHVTDSGAAQRRIVPPGPGQRDGDHIRTRAAGGAR
ncbi:hypothetical protein [Nocardia donostiensis]|nr:hypothetical protein [Nocardia donostiensis]